MAASWATDEMASADLKDERLNQRLTTLLSALGERPTASIPAACGGFNDMIAAYRFFDNDKVTYQNVLEPHVQQTQRRIAEQKVVLLIQDTTDLDLTRPGSKVAGAGSLGSLCRFGAFLHPLVAFTPDGTPLGTCWATMWTREEPAEETRPEKERRRKATPFAEKESRRWVDGLREARAIAQRVPEVRCVAIADSEADVYELFAEPRGDHPVHWLVRACQDRAVRGDAADPGADPARTLRAAVEAQPVLFEQEIKVRGRDPKFQCNPSGRNQPRAGHPARVEVRATTVTLRPPPRPDGKLPEVTVHVVQAREVDPPPEGERVEWLLVTTLPIENEEQVREVLRYYTVRFLIEVLFRVLKSGCRVEERRFEHIDRMLPCAALYLIVAWRTLMVCRLGRGQPELDCEALFDPAEWKSVWMVVKRKRPPQKPPGLQPMLRLIAGLGGYVDTPGRVDPPGPQTTWLGLQRMYDLAMAWRAFGPGATDPKNGGETCV